MEGKEIRALRGSRLGMVFQEPMTSLNPSMTIGKQLEEPLKLHTRLDAAARRAKILEILRRVGIHDPEGALLAFPHHFSGGMRQRMMLASAMLLRPSLLIADEPTTALDALVQREVLELMAQGHSNRSIAGLLVVSERAVEKHVAAVFTKFDLRATDADNRRVKAVLAYLADEG